MEISYHIFVTDQPKKNNADAVVTAITLLYSGPEVINYKNFFNSNEHVISTAYKN